jgi:hypothetical protein
MVNKPFKEQLADWKQSDVRNTQRMRFVNLCKDIPRIPQTLLDALEKETKDGLSFWDQPASTMYHGSELGGLVKHVLKVYDFLQDINNMVNAHLSNETMVIVALFHDFCKIQSYVPKILKDGSLSQAEKCFDVLDQLPLGHGEKSVILLGKFMNLTEEEMMLIRWHMGSFDYNYKQYQAYCSKAFANHLLLYFADHLASLSEGDVE